MTRTTTILAALCSVLVLASCGQDEGDPIPQRRAATLERLLQQVQRQSDAGSCNTLVDATIPRLEQEAERLPDGVGEDTRTTIEDGIAHLRELAQTDCTEQQQDEPQDTTEETTESTTTEDPTTTTPDPTTTTEEPPPTTTETTTPEPTTPPDDPDPDPDPDPGGGGSGGTPPGQGGTPPGQEKKSGKKDKDGDEE